MAITGYYYLHTDGSLIWKRYLGGDQVADFRESPFVRHFWPLDINDRETAWTMLVEALALGADPVRVHHLANGWGCTDQDAKMYADLIGAQLKMDGNAWCASRIDAVNLQESPHGFGDTALDALAELCKELGFRAQKTWGTTFKQLVAA